MELTVENGIRIYTNVIGQSSRIEKEGEEYTVRFFEIDNAEIIDAIYSTDHLYDAITTAKKELNLMSTDSIIW